MNIVQALTDPKLLGHAFGDRTWRTWRALLAAAFALPLSKDDAATVARLTERLPPTAPVRELLVLAGRRGGKSNVAAAVAVYLATLRRWKLAAGEVGTVLVLAVDREQARIAFRYCLGLLESSPVLTQEVHSTTADTIRLRSGIEICIGTSDKASVRGRTVLAAVLDELAFWGTDADEVLRALRPSMASQPAALLIAITTAYSQRGPVFETFKRYFATNDPRVMVVRATTRDLNETIPQSFIDDEIARDPQAAAAEYLGQFRSDLESLFDLALVDRATRSGPRELPRLSHTLSGTPITYKAGIDVSGGRQDAAAAAVSHLDGDRVIVDACRRWPSPHNPDEVAREVAKFLLEYNLTSGYADQYGAELSRTIYSAAGVSLQAAPVNRSEAYLHTLPLFTAGRIEIPDEPTLRAELLQLERRVGRSGKDSCDHPPGCHDDLANAVALAAWASIRRTPVGNQVAVFPSQVASDWDRTFSQDRSRSIDALDFLGGPTWPGY